MTCLRANTHVRQLIRLVYNNVYMCVCVHVQSYLFIENGVCVCACSHIYL